MNRTKHEGWNIKGYGCFGLLCLRNSKCHMIGSLQFIVSLFIHTNCIAHNGSSLLSKRLPGITVHVQNHCWHFIWSTILCCFFFFFQSVQFHLPKRRHYWDADGPFRGAEGSLLHPRGPSFLQSHHCQPEGVFKRCHTDRHKQEVRTLHILSGHSQDLHFVQWFEWGLNVFAGSSSGAITLLTCSATAEEIQTTDCESTKEICHVLRVFCILKCVILSPTVGWKDPVVEQGNSEHNPISRNSFFS